MIQGGVCLEFLHDAVIRHIYKEYGDADEMAAEESK